MLIGREIRVMRETRRQIAIAQNLSETLRLYSRVAMIFRRDRRIRHRSKKMPADAIFLLTFHQKLPIS